MLWKCVLCCSLGLLLTLSFAPFSLFPIAIISIAGLYYHCVESKSKKEVFIKTTCFGFSHYLSSMYWLAAPLFVDISTYYFVLPFSLIVTPAVLSLFISIPGLIAHHFCGSSRALKIVIFTSSFILAELFRTYIIPFPWNLIGYVSDGFLPLMQCSRILTIHGLGFVVILFSIGVFSRLRYIVAVSCTLFVVCIAYGFYNIWQFEAKQVHTDGIENALHLRIVQPNSSHFLNDTYGEREEKFYKLLDMIIKELPQNNNLIVLPEGAIPFNIVGKDDPVIKIIQNIAAEYNTEIIMAANYRAEAQFHYNSAILVDANGIKDVYSKNILVPFGEYIPFKSILQNVMTPLVMDDQDFKAGEEKRYFAIKKHKIFMSICFESIFPQFFYTIQGGYIMNLTNDVWLGKTIGPYQHFTMAKFRAIESGVHFIRAANTGVSALINPVGRIVESAQMFCSEVIDLTVL